MSAIRKHLVVDENQKPIAVVIPIDEFQRIEAALEKSGFGEPSSSAPEPLRGATRETWKDEQQWLKEHRAEFVGQWVALFGDRLLAHGMDPKEVYESAQRQGVANPLFTRIEPLEEFQFGGWM